MTSIEALYEAIDKEDLVGIQKSIRHIQAFNITFHGQTLLNYAIDQGKIEICKYFIQEKIMLIVSNEENASIAPGCAPLHIAAQKGFLDIVIALIEAGVDKAQKNLIDQQQYTAIHYAILNGQFQIVAYLLAQDAEMLKAQHKNQDSLLHLGIRTVNEINIPGPLGYAMPKENYFLQRKVVERLIQEAPHLLEARNEATHSPLEQAVIFLNERDRCSHYPDHLCDLIALLLYYQAQKDEIDFSKTNFKAIVNRTLQKNYTVNTEKSQKNIEETLKQSINYHKVLMPFIERSKTKNLNRDMQDVFHFLIKILYSFKEDVRLNIEQTARCSQPADQKLLTTGIFSLPQELIDKIVFYLIEDYRKDATAYRPQAFEFWQDARDTSENFRLNRKTDLPYTAVSLWREFLPHVLRQYTTSAQHLSLDHSSSLICR